MLHPLASPLAFGSAFAQDAGRSDAPLRLRFGVAAFGSVDPLRSIDTVTDAGFDYVEPALSLTWALPPADLDSARARVRASGIRVETMNWFLPGADIKLTGPDVDRARIRQYVEHSLALAESFGARVIVFGSPGARTAPDGFPLEKAWDQLKEFLRTCAEVIDARGYGMVIGIEALRRPETNVINSVTEALKLATEVAHPKIRLIVDFYHLAFENEDPDVILEARDMIVHLQIAAPGERMFPTREADDPRYGAFFRNLRRIGYQGRISIEADSNDLENEARSSLAFLKAMVERYGR